jgi:hypothetical protein
VQSIIENPRLLILGYGGNDIYINTWLTRSAVFHGDKVRVGVVTQLPKQISTDRNNLLDIVGYYAKATEDQIREIRHLIQESEIKTFGQVAMITAGFLESDNLEDKLIDFLA